MPDPWEGYCFLEDPGFAERGERGVDKRDATPEGSKQVDAEIKAEFEQTAWCREYKKKNGRCCSPYGDRK